MDLQKQTLRVGGFDFDLQSGELRKNGEKIRLPEQPFKILQLLVARRDKVITREELRAQLWPADTFVDFDRGLNSAMKKLRDALGDSAEEPKYIETLPRRGYRLIAPVREPEPHVPLRWMPWVVAGVAIVIIAAVAFWRFRAAAPPPQIRSIAVLPLANLSGDAKQEYFSDGMTEALITDLAQLQEVRVISRTSVMHYKNTKETLPQIARELNVDGVVEGGVVRSGSRVRVTVQLIRAATDQHLWARSFEREMSDIVTLQRDLSTAMSEAIHAQLTSHVQVRRVDPQAYELYLRGTVVMGKQTVEGINEGITYLEKAVAMQPDFAQGYAALSVAYTQLQYSGSVAPSDWMLHAKQAALKAVQLDPQLPAGHTALGLVYFQYWNWAASEQELRRALALNPNDVSALRQYAMLLRFLHRDAEANAASNRARSLEPVREKSAGNFLAQGLRFAGAGDYPHAISEMRSAVQMSPTVPRYHFLLGGTLMAAGQRTEGIAELEEAVRLSPTNARFKARLACAYAISGDERKARAILADLEKRSAKAFISPTAMALVHISLHENQQALDLLERAYRERDSELLGILGGNDFKPLRSEPRFQALVQKIGLPAG